MQRRLPPAVRRQVRSSRSCKFVTHKHSTSSLFLLLSSPPRVLLSLIPSLPSSSFYAPMSL
eukprot:762112-Hanusia_phi.AAC.2